MVDIIEIAKQYDRNVEGQLLWLTTKKGIPQAIAEQVIQATYVDVAAGNSFIEKGGLNAGHWLDRYILNGCEKVLKDAQEDGMRVQKQLLDASITTFFTNAAAYAEAIERPGNWIKHPLRALWHYRNEITNFITGLLIGGSLWHLLT